MAKTLINSMVKDFEPQEHHNEYQKRLRQIIEDKINGKEIVSPSAGQTTTVIDLMEALKASVEQVKKGRLLTL